MPTCCLATSLPDFLTAPGTPHPPAAPCSPLQNRSLYENTEVTTILPLVPPLESSKKNFATPPQSLSSVTGSALEDPEIPWRCEKEDRGLPMFNAKEDATPWANE